MKTTYTSLLFLLVTQFCFAQATYRWNVNGTPASWAVATNWTPARTNPAATDTIVFDGSFTPTAIVNFIPTSTIGALKIRNAIDLTLGVSSDATLTIGNGTFVAAHTEVQANCTLRLNSGSGNTLYLTVAGLATISGHVIFTNSAHRLSGTVSNAITFASGSSFTSNASVADPFGTTVENNVIFAAGSRYIHNSGSNPFGLAAPRSVVQFQKGSLYQFRPGVSTFFTGNGRTYGNLEIDNSTSATITGSLPMRVDTLLIRSTSSLTYTASGGIIISGDLTATGPLNIRPSSSSFSSTPVLFDGPSQAQNVSGTIAFNAASVIDTVVFAVAHPARVNLQTNITGIDSVNVHGYLYMNNQTITGGGFNMYQDVALPSSSVATTLNSNVLTGVANIQNYRVGMKINPSANFSSPLYVTRVIPQTSTLHLSRFATASGTITIQPEFNVATLGIGSPDGITSSGPLGNVNTLVRNFQSRGVYEYSGPFQQRTGTGLPGVVKSLVMTKTAIQQPVTLTSSLIVEDNLSLFVGILNTTSASILTLRDSAKVFSSMNFYLLFNEGWEESFIRGPMRIIASTPGSKIAPVGKNNLFAPVRLTKMNTGEVIYTIEYFDYPYSDVSTDTLPLSHVSQLEHWLISSNTTGTAVNAKVSLSWRPSSRVGNGNPSNDAQALNDLVVAHYINDGAGNKWRIDGADQAVMPKSFGANVSFGMVTTNIATGSFSPFALGSRSPFNILPIRLISFSGKSIDENNYLYWRVENQQKATSYILESSDDGIVFSSLSTIVPKIGDKAEYSFVDNRMAVSKRFYRLKIVNSRHTTFSPILILGSTLSGGIEVYPNPVTDVLFIDIPAVSSNSRIEIVNSSGRVIKLFSVAGNKAAIQVNDLAAGSYYLRIHSNQQTSTRKFIKR
jgi:hypothetical protein